MALYFSILREVPSWHRISRIRNAPRQLAGFSFESFAASRASKSSMLLRSSELAAVVVVVGLGEGEAEGNVAGGLISFSASLASKSSRPKSPSPVASSFSARVFKWRHGKNSGIPTMQRNGREVDQNE